MMTTTTKTNRTRRTAGAQSKRRLVRCVAYLTPAESQEMAATTLLGFNLGPKSEGDQVLARGRSLRRAVQFYLAYVRRHGGDDLRLLCGSKPAAA